MLLQSRVVPVIILIVGVAALVLAETMPRVYSSWIATCITVLATFFVARMMDDSPKRELHPAMCRLLELLALVVWIVATVSTIRSFGEPATPPMDIRTQVASACSRIALYLLVTVVVFKAVRVRQKVVRALRWLRAD